MADVPVQFVVRPTVIIGIFVMQVQPDDRSHID
jgi:hypothetical protein